LNQLPNSDKEGDRPLYTAMTTCSDRLGPGLVLPNDKSPFDLSCRFNYRQIEGRLGSSSLSYIARR
jgi:hypothetical protein